MGILAGAQMGDFTCILLINYFVKGFPPFHSRPSNVLILAFRRRLEGNTGKIRRHFVVLILGPALERVIVALVAIESGCQKEMSGVLHDGIGLAQDFVVRGRRVFLVRSLGRENLARERVIRGIGFNLVSDPIAEQRSTFGPEKLAIDLQQVGPLVGPVIHKLTVAHEVINQGFPFLAGTSLIAEKGLNGIH